MERQGGIGKPEARAAKQPDCDETLYTHQYIRCESKSGRWRFALWVVCMESWSLDTAAVGTVGLERARGRCDAWWTGGTQVSRCRPPVPPWQEGNAVSPTLALPNVPQPRESTGQGRRAFQLLPAVPIARALIRGGMTGGEELSA